METLPVTLIVKAPNQQIEDQTVRCELSWTIQKLKQHLSEVYPSKPPRNEQKLIYSGKLLNDSVVLKDILRQFDGQDTHTVHLVCTPKFTPQTESSPQTTAAPPREQSAASAAAVDPPPPHSNEPFNNQRFPDWYNHQFNMMDAQTMQLVMQQAYMQYMNHYISIANHMQNVNYGQPIAETLQQAAQAIPDMQDQPQDPAQPPAYQPQAQQPQIPNIPEAHIGRDPDREGNRDWLDVFYLLSRMMVFISVVYFYSSPVRFIFVVVLGLALYLYQIGFFRNVNINNNNIAQGDAAEIQAPTRLMVLWTFFTTFFASLIPEIPNVI
ncbi:PREDICTED: homocysteine-responsive endoplasmic reticulum-resident ubiquitin-like domain member 2 protein [Nicrophorus vespilloides]|uniref:Homocysteine-responsive endoplasmic reticulum-resident ubiquitin-like domain member 2 protein n=1 Tax=Nicrophorus vespilloides TaxID=110193 RepID=A0ABM1MQJ5_NICVS|nr:PREDICTED: homocysteine-responsive endoplasmic reticulum-resident ubiquitin-like domain member 2 protein [Nicrophorus vespilloides]